MVETSGTCGSCGHEVTDLVNVRRVYVTPERWDTEGTAELRPEPEEWCFPCRSIYPHVTEADEAP